MRPHHWTFWEAVGVAVLVALIGAFVGVAVMSLVSW
jgi:hypothetical protein